MPRIFVDFAHPDVKSFGRVGCILGNELPGSLLNAGDLALVSQLAEADTADTVLFKNRVRTAANSAAGIGPG